jgi:hypothetical protein
MGHYQPLTPGIRLIALEELAATSRVVRRAARIGYALDFPLKAGRLRPCRTEYWLGVCRATPRQWLTHTTVRSLASSLPQGWGRPSLALRAVGASVPIRSRRMGFIHRAITRLAGALALMALVAAAASDLLFTGFWDRHAMMTSVVSALLVLLVGVAVVNEFVAARSRRRWQLVADYALVELSRASRRVWVQLAEAIGVGQREELTRLELSRRVRQQTHDGRMAITAAAAAGDPPSRRRLYQLTSKLVREVSETLTGWASVLVETPDARALSRFAALHASLSAVDLTLREEVEGRRASSEATGNPHWIGSRIASVIALGCDLEDELWAASRGLSQHLDLGEGL